MRLALETGEPVRIEPQTVADGLAAPFAGAWTLATCQRYLEDRDRHRRRRRSSAGLRFAIERMKQVLEPAGAAALAAVLDGRIPIRDGETVASSRPAGTSRSSRLGQLLEAAAPLPVRG